MVKAIEYRSIILLLFIIAAPFSSVSCISRSAVPEFDYNLIQQAFKQEDISPLILQKRANSITFTVAFKGGGKDYDKARLESYGNTERIVLYNTSGALENMWVIFRMTGSIFGLEPGHYNLQIKDSNDTLIAENTFTLP